MGLFDFMKGAGQPAPKPEPVPMTKDHSPDEIQRLNERRIAMGLVKQVEEPGLGVQDLSVWVDGDVATVGGKVADQESKEKVVLAVGNTQGIAQVDGRIEVEAAQPESQLHTVVSGGSPSLTAKRCYGDAMKYPVIFEANKPMLIDPDKIYPGQVLRIPPID